MQRPEEAKEILNKCIAKDSESLIALYDLATIHLTAGEPKEAIELLERLLEKDPNHTFIYYQLGLAFNQLGWHNEALLHLNKALEINPDDHNTRKLINSINQSLHVEEASI